MNELEQRVKEAKNSREKLELLLSDYLPFIKKQVGSMIGLGLEYDDMLSIAMLVFTNCVQQYEIERGNFLTFVKVSLKNRLIDESRREMKNKYVIPLYQETDDEALLQAQNQVALQHYDKEMERENLSIEIEDLSGKLKQFDITFSQLAAICPKHSRAKRQCFAIASALSNHEEMKRKLMESKKIPQKELAGMFNVSVKTIEKHRKYIVALVILINGDYPGIQAFLPKGKEVEM